MAFTTAANGIYFTADDISEINSVGSHSKCTATVYCSVAARMCFISVAIGVNATSFCSAKLS